MAKIKTDSVKSDSATSTSKPEVKEVTIEATPVAPASADTSTADVFAMMQEMKKMMESLNQKLEQEKAHSADLEKQLAEKEKESDVVPTLVAERKVDDGMDRLIEVLGNKKSDKEVTIVHNCERIGGLSTSIRLTNMNIDFHSLGEQRVLNWQ